MILNELKIYNLRNILNIHLKLNQRFNFLIGPNGCGKTSVLEGFYFLSCGHSFRSREISSIITHDQCMLTIFARGNDEASVSIQKTSKQNTQIKLNNQACFKTSQLAYNLPALVFYSDIFQIIDAGPSFRRALLDWGLFHVKHEYLCLWKTYKRILKQRNALLKTSAPYSHFIPWDIQLNHLAQNIHSLRENYFSLWQQTFLELLHQLTDVCCTLHYCKGWDRKNSGKTFKESLEESFESDKLKLYTQQGPHQADILIQNNEIEAKQSLSRGQQKIILITMKLAQADLLKRPCLYLIDDMTAELDELHQKRLIEHLMKRQGQYIITSTQATQVSKHLTPDLYTIYHLNNGQLS